MDDIFLMQSDPMKVLPPKDGDVLVNGYGTAILSVRTLYGMTEDKYKDTVKKVVDRAFGTE